MSDLPLPVTLLGGFLGAGKTTLLQSMLRQLQGRRVAVLVNDFGSLEIDADLVESVEQGVTRLKGGCMCCAIRDSAVSTVLRMAEQDPPPEHVIVEASGVSDSAVLKDTFRALERHQTVRLDGLLTLIDAEHFDPEDREVGLLQRCQVMAADLVVINKTDLVPKARTQEVEHMVAALAPQARVWVTEQAQVPQEILLGLAVVPGPAQVGPAPIADDLLMSHRLDLGGPIEGRALVLWLADLPPGVFRAKGFVRLAERPKDKVLVQVVARRVHIQTVGAWADDAQPGALGLICRPGAIDEAPLQQQLQRLVSDARTT